LTLNFVRAKSCGTYFLDKRKDVLHHALEQLFFDCVWANREVADDYGFKLSRQILGVRNLRTILNVVVDGIVLRRKLLEE